MDYKGSRLRSYESVKGTRLGSRSFASSLIVMLFLVVHVLCLCSPALASSTAVCPVVQAEVEPAADLTPLIRRRQKKEKVIPKGRAPSDAKTVKTSFGDTDVVEVDTRYCSWPEIPPPVD